jgi:mannan endo-1,4-beta-mannosidase
VVWQEDQSWFAQFYNNEDLTGTPAVTFHEPWIGHEWGGEAPIDGMVWPDSFSARWTRRLRLKTGHYRFCAMSDDGTRIWVGRTLVLDAWHANNGIVYCGEYQALAGIYTVKVEYYEHGGMALIYVWWELE